ncbi:hypothetical protein SAMN05421823_11950 [Catalinimonas alkaloidigena]|uniref:Uncharacterized protein n=1 Tax=Catalinimonas alkaloidigena TaxID=1075417 RepID=A0A1G9V8Q7_9BACT|nr:hypothetical protein [Catalinimonas alkaloidigena]SDM68446.1 hypothetical protein SAMN05421823_11950 [Catalinimonas alkaloidigena]
MEPIQFDSVDEMLERLPFVARTEEGEVVVDLGKHTEKLLANQQIPLQERLFYLRWILLAQLEVMQIRIEQEPDREKALKWQCFATVNRLYHVLHEELMALDREDPRFQEGLWVLIKLIMPIAKDLEE